MTMHRGSGNDPRPLFPLGLITITPTLMLELDDEPDQSGPDQIAVFLVRHVMGDWGDVDPHDKLVNDAAVKDGSRILSSYTTRGKKTVWIITEASREYTTILRPADY